MDILPFETKSQAKRAISLATRSSSVIKKELQFHGHNKDLVEPYYWHINFPYYTGKGYVPIKVEDHHYFSENSQFGGQIRQVKGGSIRVFQENLQQLIQLVKVHMMPLLKEVKQTEEYKLMIDTIVNNDAIYQQGLKDGKSKEDIIIKKAIEERDEAILHLKDKWVSEVDGGRMYQMSGSQAERGLDMVLLPQLFFGTKLDNPLHLLHGKGQSLKEQLDDYIYKVDITQDAINQVARFQYRFYNWLPTVVKEVTTEFRIKIASLKQFYSQLQMYIKFMKPLLLEVAKKTEGLEKTSMYYNFEEHNPDFWNLLDSSYSYSRILGIKTLLRERGGEGMDVMRFCPFGYYLPGKYIAYGKYAGQGGIITKQEGDYYLMKLFSPNSYNNQNRDAADKLSAQEFMLLEEVMIPKIDLLKFSVMEFEFSQKRRGDVIQTQQGPQQVPFCQNKVVYHGFTWDMYEVATYKESLKQDELELLEGFIEEIGSIKEDLLHYVGLMERTKLDQTTTATGDTMRTKNKTINKENKSSEDGFFSLFSAPIEGLGVLVSVFLPSSRDGSSGKLSSNSNMGSENKTPIMSEKQKADYEVRKADVAEDTWKLYTIFKKSHGFMQY
jgi:hypothetical protein